GQRDPAHREPARRDVARDDRDAEAVAKLVLVLDVVAMRVRAQQVGGCKALPLDDIEQRGERCSAVDEHRRSPGPVSEEVGIGQEALVHRPADDHSYTLREGRGGGLDSPPMRRLRYVVLGLMALALGFLAAGCLDGTETTATPETVVGKVPQAS